MHHELLPLDGEVDGELVALQVHVVGCQQETLDLGKEVGVELLPQQYSFHYI